MSEKPAILVTRRLPFRVEAALAEAFTVTLNETDVPLSPEALLAAMQGKAGLVPTVGDRLSADVIAELPESVRIIATFSVGTDHIDLAAAKARGICVTNTPGVLTDATADLTILLILAATRRAGEGERLVRAGRWTGWAPTQLLGVGLAGKRLGILGMGRIGRAVAARARPFGLEIHYHNRRPLPPDQALGAVYHPHLDDLLAHSDILSLHCPATEETRGLLTAERIARLPRGAVVINTARGDLVDDDALIAALRSGHLFAAGLDVFAGEPHVNPGYMTLENVVLLPHLGSATQETREAMGFCVRDNLVAFFQGHPPPNRVV